MDLRSDAAHVRRVEPLASGWRSACWQTGMFDTAQRPRTEMVEGTIRIPHPMLLVTLRGTAERLEVATDCGHRYDGPESPGAVSFVPGHCERRLRLHRVRSEWASISLRPELLAQAGPADAEGSRGAIDIGPFTNLDDGFLAGSVTEFWRLLNSDGSLDPLYCETMSLALAHYLVRRYGRPAGGAARPMKLAPWQMRRIAEFVDARLGGEIRISDLAALVGVSVGHFHRAFRCATGRTPLSYINEARVRRALSILATENVSVAELAIRVGFLSPGYFARVFRGCTGSNPSAVRRD